MVVEEVVVVLVVYGLLCFHVFFHTCLDSGGSYMVSYGQGYCHNGYYMGWDDLGTANEEACQQLCYVLLRIHISPLMIRDAAAGYRLVAACLKAS